jgi:hypothetical protein
MKNRNVVEQKEELDLTVKGGITKSELAEIDEAVRLLKDKRKREKFESGLLSKNLN